MKQTRPPFDALPSSWVVVRLSALGDVVLTTGLLDLLHRERGWTFAVLTKAANAPVLEGHPAVTEIIRPGPGDLGPAAWARYAAGLARRLAGSGLLDLHGALRSRLLSLLWKGPVRRYTKLSLERRLLSRLGPARAAGAAARLAGLNVPQRYSLAVFDQARSREELRPRLFLAPAELAAARDMLAGAGLDPDSRPVALHPYATHPGKEWPAGHWQALAGLLDRAGVPWFTLGRSGAPSPLPGPRDLSNRTDLRQAAALIALSRRLATGDSGPMHLGTAVGTPVVALFGPTTVHWGFFPCGPADRVLEPDLPCRPCSLHGGRGCDRPDPCMAAIAPETVLDAVLAEAPAR
ncbi:MAG: glycosyltransferase family 9 protein [Thermodesulfobacteriota bacterium]